MMSKPLDPRDPKRTITLQDGTTCSPKGKVTFIGESQRIVTGNEYVVDDLRKGVDSGREFVGISMGDDVTIRFMKENFVNGKVYHG